MATTDDLVAVMDEDGVDVSVVMGIGWTDPGVAREANDYVVESVARHPGRLVGFAGANPAWPDGGAGEAERCAAAGLRGVGEMHPDTQRFDIGDAATMAPLVDVAREHGLVLTTHSSEPVGHSYPGKGRTRPEALWRFIQAHPDVVLVCAHWGGGLPFYALMPEVAAALGNVYFDTAASPFLYDERDIRRGGATRGPREDTARQRPPAHPPEAGAGRVGPLRPLPRRTRPSPAATPPACSPVLPPLATPPACSDWRTTRSSSPSCGCGSAQYPTISPFFVCRRVSATPRVSVSVSAS